MRWDRVFHPSTAADWAISTALLPLSWLYGFGWRSYAAVYQLGLKKRASAGIPVVGIGNLQVGGTGKTPATIAIAQLLLERGLKVAVSSSGYGSPSSGEVHLFSPGERVAADKYGDEPALLRWKLPEAYIVTGRDRVAAARAAKNVNADVVLLDDGFQHLPLARSADLILWNEDLINRRLLPAGPLREPRSGLDRADAILSNADSKQCKPTFLYLRRYTGLCNLDKNEILSTDWLRGKEIVALCAIARPGQFFEALENLGANVKEKVALADHADLRTVSLPNTRPLVVTDKDAVKLLQRNDLHAEIYSLQTEVVFQDAEGLTHWLLSRIKAE